MELGFAVSGGALEHGCDLIVLEAFDVVEDEDHTIARGERGDSTLEGDTVDRAGELKVAAAEVAFWRVVFGGVDSLFEGDEVEAFFAQVHQDQIYRKSMKPCRKSGFAAEASNFSEEMEESFLGHVFSFRDISEHAEAKRVDTTFMKRIELGERLCVSVFGRFDRFGFADDRRISLEGAGGRCILGHL